MSFASIAIVATVGSAALSMYGQHQASKAGEAAARANNDMMQAEARNHELETAEAIKRERQNNESMLSSLRNRMSGSGFLTTSGTPLLLEAETAGRMEIGIQDAARSARMNAASMRAKGQMGIWESKMNSRATKINMVATGLKGIGSAYSGYKLDKSIGLYPRIGGG